MLPTVLAAVASLLAAPAAAEGPLPRCAPGWKVETIAVAPDILHPTVVAFAPDGRFFVAEDPMDISAPADATLGRVLCFHPDGRRTVFAEGLHAVFGMGWLEGKLYVLHNPKLTVFADGGAAAAGREDLISSTLPEPWALDWNDHVPANFRLAMDGFLYASVGDKGVYDCRGRDGKAVSLHGGGVLRLRPDATGLEVFATGTRNHLDVAITAEDEVFTYDNTDERDWWSRVAHMVDGGYYGYPWDHVPPRPHMLPAMADYGPGAATAALCYEEDALPEEHRGSLFLADFGRREVFRLRIERSGATFRVAAREDLLWDAPEDFRPVGLGLAPDGVSFVIADWRHSDVKAKVQAGRLLRLTYTGASRARALPPWYLSAALGRGCDASDEDLFSALRHPSRDLRLCAQRRIAERGPRVAPALEALLADASAPAPARWHALWALDAIDGGVSGRKAILAALGDGHASLRRQAARQLGTRRAAEAAGPLARLLGDGDASVRFHAAAALGRIGDPAYVPALLARLGDEDAFARFACFTALGRIGRARSEAWTAIARGLESADGRAREGALLALRDAYDERAAAALEAFAADASRPGDARAGALATLAGLHRKLPPWDGGWWAYHPVERPRPRKTVAWGGTEAVLRAVEARLADREPLVRRAAAEGLAEAGGDAAFDCLRARLAEERDLETRRVLLRAVSRGPAAPARDAVAGVIEGPFESEALLEEALAAAEWLGRDGRLAGAVARLLERPVPSEALAARAAAALARIGSEAEAPSVLRLLERPEAAVRKAAASALGELSRGAPWDAPVIQALLEASSRDDTRLEAARALARRPDPRALDAYLFGLALKSPALREPFRQALRAIAGESRPDLERRAAGGALGRDATIELRRLYSEPRAVRRWRVLGPLPHPSPDPFDPAAAGTASVAWRELEAAEDGKIAFPAASGAGASAHYALAEAPSSSVRSAELRLRADGAVALWLNGRLLFERRDGSWGGGERTVEAHLRKGSNHVLVRVADLAGGGAALRLQVPEPGAGPLFEGDLGELDPEAHAELALGTPGDAGRGGELFRDLEGAACAKCHAVAGEGGRVGPDLAGIAAQQDRKALLESVLYPSRRVRPEYQQVVVVTRSGEVLAGILRGETGEELTIVDAEGAARAVRKAEIERREPSELSLMPEGLSAGLTPEELADVIAYLESLKALQGR
ncbi:MAG: HEAT repeat domain-containing protein [Planctomycetes bacterium]|nr:HEAT repeat domain-containing protein [Planctomycetota bacterium]